MNTIIIKVIDEFGEASQLTISINEKKRTGVLELPIEKLDLIKLELKQGRVGIQGWIKLSSFNMKFDFLLLNSKADFKITVAIAGTPHIYTLSNTEFNKLKSFISTLNLPIDNHGTVEEISLKANNEEFVFDDSQIQQEHLYFFIAKRPTDEVELDIKSIIVNRVPNIDLTTYELPIDQGIYVSLGLFRPNTMLSIHWKFETYYVKLAPVDIIVGIFRKLNLRDRVVFQKYSVEMFESYVGHGSCISSNTKLVENVKLLNDQEMYRVFMKLYQPQSYRIEPKDWSRAGYAPVSAPDTYQACEQWIKSNPIKKA